MKGLYIHIPFCIKKCNYCDFASYPCMLSKEDIYVNRLIDEIKSYKDNNIKADTVYFGGGTPSLLKVENISKILNELKSNFDISENSEITLEINPSTIDYPKAKKLKECGINRVSLGSQSFVDEELKLLGRTHLSDDITQSFNTLRESGFNNISLDLMYALPNQSMQTLSTSVDKVLKLNPEHISCYGLKIEDNTPFGKMLSDGTIKEKSDDEYAKMYELIIDILEKNGYNQYEISNFSKEGFESKHNLKYWLSKEYIGLGLSASSYYSSSRYTNTYDFDKYMKSFEKAENITLSKEDKMSEYMILSLRLCKIGANKKEFEKLFGISIKEKFSNQINKHIKTGMIIEKEDRFILNPKAYFVSNSILCDFI